MAKSKVVRSAVVLSALGLALAACSSSDASSDESGAASPAASAEGNGTLVIGTLLPQTGSLAFLGPPEFAGVALAAQEINDAGGVNGGNVEIIDGDSGDTSTNIAAQTVDRLISQGADAIVGAASSSVTLTVIDKVTSAGVAMVSPANTSTELTDYPDNGLYFRTAPPDTLQGQVLADQALADGNQSICIMALQDAYGEGLADVVDQVFTENGGEVTEKIIYDPKAASFEAEVGQCAATNSDAIVLIGFDESKKILQEMIKQGVGPQDTQLYLVDGNLSNTLAEGLPAGIMEGVKGTTPGAAPSDEFRASLLETDPNLVDFSYAAESYDAVILIALAAQQAGDDSGASIAANIASVSGQNDEGESCNTFEACKALLEDGKDINYEGQSGPINLDDNGDPARAAMGVYVFGADNTNSRQDTVVADVPAAS
ncbi:MAG: ABC transporter substrate-binding protein [Actinobacteria bacterium]|nr:ABC transporter substrate-binding protein [Actinomycetota bacterium]MCB9412560.1 ABC transporter substrate-binding protein [Actinomycetota bacterium]